MTDVQEFCLRWNNHQSNLISAFYDLRAGEDFVDVTLACEGRSLQAHKVVLSACSPFFRDLLKTTPCKHPVIVLKDILYNDLVALIEFMYQGEVRVKHNGLPSFLRTAEVLQVRGLTEQASKQDISQLNSDLLLEKIPENLNPSPLFIDEPSVHVQLHEPVVSLNNCNDVEANQSNGTAAKVKVEEVDLDSGSEEMCTARKQNNSSGAALMDDNDCTQEEADEFHPPSLTLQSFARIPALSTQDFNPHVIQKSNACISSLAKEHNCSQEMLQATIMEQDNPPGRTPGRMSSSDRPRWPCPFCMRLLSSRSSVRRHIEDRHTNDTSRHPCPLCERLYRTRNSLQYHLSTAHRDREPGPRGRPRTRPRSPSATGDTHLGANKHSSLDPESPRNTATNNSSTIFFNQNRGPPFGLPPI